MSTVCVVIVNYRSGNLVCDCLAALMTQFVPEKIVVVDNNSGDESLRQIRSFIELHGWKSACAVVASEVNGGFSYGNNIGVEHCRTSNFLPDYFFLINPDAVAAPCALDALVKFMDSHPQAGIAGSSLTRCDGEMEASSHVFPSPIGELEGSAKLGLLSKFLARYVVTPSQPAHAALCDWVSGASMIIRTKVIQEIGLMDEGFFLYFEEVDFCKRAKAAGWECWYVPESRVMHLEGASTGIKEINKRRPRYWYDSRRRYFVKHHGIFGLILADCLWATGRVTYLLRRALKLGAQGENRDPRLFMFDLLWGDLRSILSGNVFRIERFGK